jgi:acyl dehydratase
MKNSIDIRPTDLYFDDAQVGDTCVSPTYTITHERIMAYADLTGDFTPVHTNPEYAAQSHFGCQVAHGLFGQSIADGLKTQSSYRFFPGMSLGWTWDFLLPIKIHDVLHVKFSVGSARRSNSKPGWGIVVLPTELINQHGQVVQKGEHRLMVPCRSVPA